MAVPRSFQVFVKPGGSLCNLNCEYCYYLEKKQLYPATEIFRLPEILLEEYIVQHIQACSEPVVRFSWHGGEPTLLGLDYFRKIIELQRLHQPRNQEIANGMQTNGTLLDEQWCGFLAAENFYVGLSLDGPEALHDCYRKDPKGKSTFNKTMRGYERLQRFGVQTDILCVVNNRNVRFPLLVYDFFKGIGAAYVSFLPLVEADSQMNGGVSSRTVPPAAFADFLCSIFDQWLEADIGKIKIQIFEEAIRTAFGLDHSLCIFRRTCGEVPVLEHNGDVYCCDHFVDSGHLLGNVMETTLAELLESPALRAFGNAKWKTLPVYCRECGVRDMCNGECPKNRFISSPSGEPGLNFLCEGYRRFFTHCQPFVAEVGEVWREVESRERRS
jgi:uncharacterized protein